MRPDPNFIAAVANTMADHGRSWSRDEAVLRVSDEYGYAHLGSGCYAHAFLQEDGSVLKVSRRQEGTMDFIEWCYLRMRKYGKGSREMCNLPEVEHFGRTQEGWWAVMPRYWPAKEFYCDDSAYLSHGTLDDDGNYLVYKFEAAIQPTMQVLRKIFGENASWDIHSGNIMWSEKRNEWIICDPLCSDATGTAHSYPQPERFRQRKVAHWKLNPLQQLRPARR